MATFKPPNPYGGFTPTLLPPSTGGGGKTVKPKPIAKTVKVRTGAKSQISTQFGPIGQPQDVYTTVNAGVRPDDRAGAGGVSTPPPVKSKGSRVQQMQQFLRSKGYDIQVDGVQGPLTTAAAADWRSNKNPTAWNTAHSGHGAAAAAAAGTPPASTPPKIKLGKPAKGDNAPDVINTPPPGSRVAADATTQTPEQQAQAIVNSILQPLMAQVKADEEARSQSGTQAISGYTGNAINQLKGIDFQAPFAGAAAGANAVNDAELAALTGQGGNLAAQVGAKLATAGQDPAAAAAQLGALTTGTSGAEYAKGGATVQDLLASGANAGAYGKSLPGIEALAGQQDERGLQGSISADQAKQLGDITSQAPQLIQTTLSNLNTQANQDKSLKINAILAAGYDPTTGALTPDARSALSTLLGTSPGALSGGSASTAGKVVTAAAAAGKIDPGVSKILGYAATADGSPVTTQGGKIIPVSKTGAKGTPKAPTANELSSMVDQWFDGKASTQHVPVTNPDGSPVTDSNGAPVYRTIDGPQTGQLNYTQAYKRLRSLNVGDQQARQILDTRYARGDRGRAWLTNEEQTALKNAGLPAKAARYKTVAYLTRDQVTALQQAHRLPPGQWAGNQYVIDQTY